MQEADLTAGQINNEIDIIETSVIRPGESIAGKIKKNLFLRAEINKTTCYIGEPLMVVYKAYSRLNTSSQVVKRPSLTGFSVLEMVDTYEDRPVVEIYNGIPYYVSVIRKVHLFPLQEGHFTLDPAEVESVIHFVRISEDAPRTAFDYALSLESPPVTIAVKPLPAAQQPANFSGAVGNFSLKVLAPTVPVHPGELVKIQVVVSGSGNISLLTPPPVKWPAGVDTADPSVKESINRYAYPLTGSKTFEYSFAAPDTGQFTIPTIELSFYDPVQKGYKTVSSKPATIIVTPGLSKEQQSAQTAALEKENSGSLPRHLYWFAVVVILILGWIAYQSWQGIAARKRSSPARVQPVVPVMPVPTAPADLLATATTALQQGNRPLFFHELQQALWDLAAVKLAVTPTSLNKENVTARLKTNGVEQPIINDFMEVLNACEWALYVPEVETVETGPLLEKARGVLQGLQSI